MPNLRIHRKAYTTKRGTKVSATSFSIKDRGNKGRGVKIITITQPGVLGAGFMSLPVAEQHKILIRTTKKYGEMSTQGRLQALATFNKNTNPSLAKRAQELRSWVAGNFQGTKYIGR